MNSNTKIDLRGMLFKATSAMVLQEGNGMRSHPLLIGIFLLIITLCYSGCDQLIMKKDHISINIMVAVNIQLLNTDNTVIEKTTDGMKVSIVITRNGHDRLVFERIMQNGLCQATGDFELTEGWYIECNATVIDENHQYHQVFPGYAKLTWGTVNASTNFGGVYNWYPKLTITVKE